ncbi:mas-related G-protein coupled receptor member B2-like [Mesoplodon densirostris]|uniref:mas-related G-protein coupled receptor member B2-like n=1 Tax=Mesoplodon densirostris TaxID=48708 RepID=UPI0028DD21E0|nr:mas-related G-protein coupled receptor member B2-like [Mesoplodon densirostris]
MSFRSITVVVALCGLVGTGIVIWFVHLSAKKTAFFIYSLNLAVEDFMNLCFQTVSSVRQILKLFLHYPFHLHDAFRVLRFFLYFTGLGIMATISSRRCLSSFFPIWYRCRCPKHLSGNVSACSGFRSFRPGELPATLAHRLCLVLLFSVLGFFLFGLPLCIIRFLVADMKNHTLSDVCILLSCINSTPNPAIYFFIGGLQRQWLREPLKVVLQRTLGEETEVGEDGKVPLTGKVERVDL